MPFYALGVSVGQQVGGKFKPLLSEGEMQVVLQGLSEQLTGTVSNTQKLALNQEVQKLNDILKKRSEVKAEALKQAGTDFTKDFLAKNPTAITTSSGLIFLSTREGAGAQPVTADTVEVHYHGTLVDGTVFDSSVERGETISFPLGQVIKGWQEGLALMKEGGEATLVVPPELAYGEEGAGDAIPPAATLQFKVELFKVTKTEAGTGHGHSHGGVSCDKKH